MKKERTRLAAILVTVADIIWALGWFFAIVGAAYCLVGCSVVPQTYGQWRKELRDRATYEAIGVEYKGPHALRAEVQEMRAAAANVIFPAMKKTTKTAAAPKRVATVAKPKRSAVLNVHPNLIQCVLDDGTTTETPIAADAAPDFVQNVAAGIRARGFTVEQRTFNSSGKLVTGKPAGE